MRQLATAILFSICTVIFAVHAETKESPKLLAEDRVVKWRITDALDHFKGQSVTLLLKSGGEISGKLSAFKTEANPSLVYLTEVSDKSYFGSLIQVSEIVGITFRNQK